VVEIAAGSHRPAGARNVLILPSRLSNPRGPLEF
jgi:hypothetical protein